MLPVRIGRQCLKMKWDNKIMLKLACFPKFELKCSRPEHGHRSLAVQVEVYTLLTRCAVTHKVVSLLK